MKQFYDTLSAPSKSVLFLLWLITFIVLFLFNGKEALSENNQLKFRQLYEAGMKFSQRLKSLNGQEVVINGFMAPPLKPDANFFVMTKMPLAVCPFCDNEADWPEDIILVRLNTPFTAVRFNRRIEVTGRLELGTQIDSETGFVSRVRIVEAEFKVK